MRHPIGKQREIELKDFAGFVKRRVVVFFEQVGVVDMVHAILRREVTETPDWQDMECQQGKEEMSLREES